MGAGKTYLMAAFIYLDLYFAQNEPNNPAFAHNFMVFAPSGLKSSIIPSLKHIKEFDPSFDTTSEECFQCILELKEIVEVIGNLFFVEVDQQVYITIIVEAISECRSEEVHLNYFVP